MYIKGIKCWTKKLHLQKFFFNLRTISINRIRSHSVTVWFNNKVTSLFGPWRMQGQSGTFVQGVYRNVKSSSLSLSALEKSQGLLCCRRLLYCFSCIYTQSTGNTYLVCRWPWHSGIKPPNLESCLSPYGYLNVNNARLRLARKGLYAIVDWLYFDTWKSCTPVWLAV